MMHPAVLLVVLLLVWGTSAQHIRYVLPNSNPSQLNCPGLPCLTIDEYTLQRETYFTTGSAFVFLAGNHSLQTALTVINISDVTLRGEGSGSQVNIVCRNDATMNYTNVTNLFIEKMMFSLYSSSSNRVLTALNIFSSSEVQISYCTFQGNENPNRRAVSLVRSLNVKISNCAFIRCSTSYSGGAIYAENSHIITLNGSTFIGNEAIGNGGAITTKRSRLVSILCTFTKSKTLRDGGVISSEYSYIILVGNIFTESEAVGDGGAISEKHGKITITGSIFIGNKAKNGGALNKEGGLIVLNETMGNTFTKNLAHMRGGAIHCHSCNFTISESCPFEKPTFNFILTPCTNNFFNNTSFDDGGAICLSGYEPSLFFSGTKIAFAGNVAGVHGGAIMAKQSIQLSGINILFEGNTANKSGGAIYINEGKGLQLDGINVEFKENMAYSGGAIFAGEIDNLAIIVPVNFTNNIAVHYGGAVAINSAVIKFGSYEVLVSGNFVNNSGKCGRAVYIGPLLSFQEYHNITLLNITALGNSGSAIFVEASATFIGTTKIANNTGKFGGGIHVEDSSNVIFSGDTTFAHNTADRDGGALYAAQRSSITLNNGVDFTSNSAQNGGAMYFTAETTLTLDQHTTLTTSHNHASLYGGAIYHEDKPTNYVCDNPQVGINENYPVCFLRLRKYNNITINSNHDTANIDGSFLNGGLLDKCRLRVDGTYNYSIIPYNFLINRIFNIISDQNQMNEISSQPYRICFCDNSYSTCYDTQTVNIVRGQKFIVPIKAITQRESHTSGIITAQTGIYARIHLNQVVQNVSNKCTNLIYNFYSSLDDDELRLTTGGSCGDTGTVQAVIRVTLLPCPHPFIQSNEECVCDRRLQEYPNITCITDEYSKSYIIKYFGTDFWMSASYFSNGSYKGLILYKTCPAEYCKSETVAVSLDNPDIQCDQNRGGVLCGECANNYSLMLGSSNCGDCTDAHLALLLPFAAAGIALVVFLSFLRLTVATGMINSVILYANIVQVNRQSIFPVNARNILTVFVAWLNLDLGFQTCFYDGMTAYAQTWLQFAFPLYVWILIGLMILSSRYSITVSKLIGHNPIAVLATLLLMSYTKVLKIIIEVYSSVDLEYPDNEAVTVWLKDANVPYFQSWHLFLTVVTTLVLVFLFLPYTLFLLLGYKLYRFSGRKYFHFLNKTKPLLDSYYAPYTIHTRYYTGFLLLVRCGLYVVFSFYSPENANKRFFAIILTFTGLVIISFAILLCFFHRLYAKLHNTVIEVSIYLNLIVISAAVTTKTNPQELMYTLVGLVFVTTLGIIVYHFHLLYIVKSRVWLQFIVKISAVKKRLSHPTEKATSESPADTNNSAQDLHIVTHSEIELREPLL